MLKKQAKTLSDNQIRTVLKFLETRKQNCLRDKVIFLLSLHGLRAKEIAALEIGMVTDPQGNVADAIALQDRASKGSSGRIIPMHRLLRTLLSELITTRKSLHVISPGDDKHFSANAIAVFFRRLYRQLGFDGCSSHSGRRTYISNCARKISEAGGSIKDVMTLAGHRHLSTTQLYIEQNTEAQKSLVNLLYKSL